MARRSRARRPHHFGSTIIQPSWCGAVSAQESQIG
jgi:hypothetical protein